VAGALGNMIDRVVHGYVIDFLYFSLIDFPVFNVADCYVCIGAAMLVLSLFTVYREDEFHFLLPGEPSGK
jgi:signal peptidase II